MTFVKLNNVDIEFPVLHQDHRSAKKSLLATVTGGRIVADARNIPVVRALENITLEFTAGERVGLIGRNGGGKTTLLRTIAGIYEPIRGSVKTQARTASMLDTQLQPEMTGYENIELRALMMGLTSDEIEAAIAEVEDFSELGDFLNMPVRIYSSGMSVRLAFAIATIGKPEVLLMDEWVLAGDAEFMKKAKKRMRDFVDRAQLLILASHSESIVRDNCDRAILLVQGRVASDGLTQTVFAQYNAQ